MKLKQRQRLNTWCQTFLLSVFLCVSTLTTITSHAADEYYFPSTFVSHLKQDTLRVYGAADYVAISPLIKAFQKSHPMVSVVYKEFSTRELYNTVRFQHDWPDLLLSPAMDLQIKLVNDGMASSYHSFQTDSLPNWATWRNQVFAFTYEPVAIAINKAILGNIPLPKDRTDLLNLIRKKSQSFDQKIGLLDIETVGLGYLTWAHDSQQSRTYGRLLEVFGAHKAKLYPNSTAMLSALANNEISVAYNVLGSYASDWASRFPELAVILPADYTSVILRSAIIPKQAGNKEQARQLLDYILSASGQNILSKESSLIPLQQNLNNDTQVSQLRRSTQSPLLPITFSFPLLLLTDQAKRNLLLKEWENSMTSQ